MNRNAPFSFKEVIILLISVIIACISLFFITYGIIETAKKGKDWLEPTIGSLGNLGGGIIGGIVAYIVASYQVRKSTDLHEQVSLKTTYSMLRLIKEEIDYNIEVLSSLIPYEDTSEHKELINSHLQETQWLNCSPNLGPEVSDATFTKLCSFYRQISVLKSSSKFKVDPDLLDAAKSLGNNALEGLNNMIQEITRKLNN
ncbi:hypothetical protein ABEV55_06775 [Aneurinibacillus thermoaerophilus]|uniref:hypothetical protein n=1 Tax=Aneurinibacillus TaxID=55079 RepID=UPI00070C6067|nr:MULTISPECIES: hypothetical protein [Aneurinibacillus]AMA72732.1 hypothetical protein ACH33_07620 [Aneurinibacillus sp. XH2]MED0674544.1 hypothetical protein [Aneurinibacillus thermoaerophilus]